MLTLVVLMMVIGELLSQGNDIHLNQMQDQDLAESLSEFDIDDDGILSAEEIQLSFTSIDYIITNHKQQNLGTNEEKKPNDEKLENEYDASSIILTAVLGGIVTVVFLVYLVWTKNSRKRELMKNELMRAKREDWLNQVTDSNLTKQRKHLVDSTTEEPALIAAKLRKTTFEKSYEKSLPSACKQRKTTFETLGKREKLYESDSSQNEEEISELPHKDKGHFPKNVSGGKQVLKKSGKSTQTKQGHYGANRHLKGSSINGVKHGNDHLQDVSGGGLHEQLGNSGVQEIIQEEKTHSESKEDSLNEDDKNKKQNEQSLLDEEDRIDFQSRNEQINENDNNFQRKQNSANEIEENDLQNLQDKLNEEEKIDFQNKQDTLNKEQIACENEQDSLKLKEKIEIQNQQEHLKERELEDLHKKQESLNTEENEEPENLKCRSSKSEDVDEICDQVSLDSANRIAEDLSSRETPANEVTDDKSLTEQDKEKTMDANKLIEFLSRVLDCQVHVADDVKTRYSLTKLEINGSDLPRVVAEIPGKLEKILQKIVPRQIDQIKYAVSCFSCCEEFENSYHDNLVIAASDWLKMTSLTIILETLSKESGIDSGEEDLWTDVENKNSASDSVKFLWRLTGWAEDNVIVSSVLLSRLLDYGDQSTAFLTNLFRAAGKQLSNVKRIDEVIFSEGHTLKALEILVSNPKSRPVLAAVLEKEVNSASEGLGNVFENNSLFGPLLSISTVPTKFLKGHTLVLTGNIASPFTTLKGFPRVTETDLQHVESTIQEGMRRCQAVVYSALKCVVTSRATRDRALAWLSAVIRLNDLRSPGMVETDAQLQACCSDAFMLNFCSCLLDFFAPIFADSTKLQRIDLGYPTSGACRLNYDFETCLAGAQIISERDRRLGPLPTNLQNIHSFITECYHLTQRSLSIGIIPAVSHYTRMHRDFSIKIQSLKGAPQEEQLKYQHVLMTLMWDTSLVDPELVRKVNMFYLAQATLLLALFEDSGQNAADHEEKLKLERKAFSKIPEFCVKDMAIWFRFAASHAMHVHKGSFRGLSLSPLVDCCVLLLERPDLMPGPIPASKIVSMLLHFVQTSENPSIRGGGWGSGVMSELAAMVHTCPAVRSKLGPALLRSYVAVDVVEGLDVDRDEFDKYSARSEMGKLIHHLWHRADCRASITELYHSELFQNFLGAILDTLLYMLHDSLSRLANIRKIEISKEAQDAWNVLSASQRTEKENFLINEEHVARGFMTLANETLDLIDLLTKADEVCRCFTEPPLAQRSASVICGFLESLCGTKAKDFKVRNMEKYNFSPKKLLSQIVEIILRISVEEKSRKDGFLVSMVTDADFEIGNLEKALSVLTAQGLGEIDTERRLSELIEELQILQLECTTDQNQGGSQLESDWLTKVASMETDHEALTTEYTSSMADHRLSTANILEAHSYYSNIQELEPRSSKVKALLKEMKQLQQNLPVHPDAAIFVRQDEDRMDVVRAVVSGPVGTPYSLGCFVFDVYFPTSYPNSPPLVKLITTGNGTVRFNPNLYSDGKVCLSLLGTWHGGNASEKWNPGKSTLYQVLLSIQSIILVPDPVFNEPGYEGRQDTPEGKQQSEQYNWKIQLHTMRHAILGVLSNPPTGTADIVRRHFFLQREAILKQCYQWLQDCKDGDLEKRFRQTLQNLYTQLQAVTA